MPDPDSIDGREEIALLLRVGSSDRVAFAEFSDPRRRHGLRERRPRVREVVAKLSPEQRTVIEMAYFKSLTQNEIAEQLQEPSGPSGPAFGAG